MTLKPDGFTKNSSQVATRDDFLLKKEEKNSEPGVFSLVDSRMSKFTGCLSRQIKI